MVDIGLLCSTDLPRVIGPHALSRTITFLECHPQVDVAVQASATRRPCTNGREPVPFKEQAPVR